MKTYQPYNNFTAHNANIQTLLEMLRSLDELPDKPVRVIPIVVFMAFSIEAYLNSLGARCIPYWEELERLPWRKKIVILHKSAAKPADWGAPHLQFAQSVFKLRDKLAHGKPEHLKGPVFTDPQEAFNYRLDGLLKPDWWKKLNKEWVAEARPKFDELMAYLGSLHGYDKSDHLLLANGGMITGDQ
jgi:hypothetical protein